MTDKSSQQEAAAKEVTVHDGLKVVCTNPNHHGGRDLYPCCSAVIPANPDLQSSAMCEHKSTCSYSEVSELGAVAKSGMRKCVACGAEIDVRSATSFEPQPSAQSVDLPPLDEDVGCDWEDRAQAYIRCYQKKHPRMSDIEAAYALLDINELEQRRDQLLAVLTENASLRQQLAAEREALEVTKKALEGGVALIAAERQRQMSVEGWTPEHDDMHVDAELVKAARSYLWAAQCEVLLEAKAKDFKFVPNDWPLEWDKLWWKPSDDPIRNLEKAGALIAAEIDRLLRQSSASSPSQEGL